MLSIKNENVLRDSGPNNLQTWRAEVPRGSALDQIMEDALNHERLGYSDDDLREVIKTLEERNMRLADLNETWRKKVLDAETMAKDLTTAHTTLAEIHADTVTRFDALESEMVTTRAQLAAALSLIPGHVPIGDLRDAARSFAGDFAELERLRGFEAARLEQDRQQAEDKIAMPPEPPSAEIPEEMFEGGYVKTWVRIDGDGVAHPIPEPTGEGTFVCRITNSGAEVIPMADMTNDEVAAYIEGLKNADPGPIQFVPTPSRRRLDSIARRACELADGPMKPTDLRRLADLIGMLANAAAPA